MNFRRRSWECWAPSAVLLGVTGAMFGATVLRCGLYADDYASLLEFQPASWGRLWHNFLYFGIPGRNLFVLIWTAAIYATRGSVVGLHGLSLLFDILDNVLAYLLVLRLTSARSLALIAALLFAAMPHHGETHFWITGNLQITAPMCFLLLAFLAAAGPAPRLYVRLSTAFAAYTIAFFSYDQFFFLWPLLLVVAWAGSDAAERRAGPFVLGAAYGLALNLCHAWVRRRYAPDAIVGPDGVQFHGVPLGFWRSIAATANGTAPLHPTSPSLPWGWTVVIVVAALAVACGLGVCIGRLMRAEREESEHFFSGSGPKRLCFFGIAWFLLAYLPNYLAYISPRHHYVPSLGWAIVLAVLGVRVWRLFPRMRLSLALSAAIAFADMAAANIHEGMEWVESARLHRAYLAEAAKYPSDIDTLFLLGAPHYRNRAMAFNLPHDGVLSAEWAAGRMPLEGDILFAPTRHGAFYRNDLAEARRGGFRWLPYAQANAIGFFGAEGFRCIRDFHLRLPDGRELAGKMRAAPGCVRHVDFALPVALAKAEAVVSGARSGGTPVPGVEGVSLRRVRLNAAADVASLSLEWSVEKPSAFPFAVVPTLVSESGEVLYEPIYESHLRDRRSRILWPLYDDEIPVARWRAHSMIRERYLLHLTNELPLGSCRVLLDIYELVPRAPSRLLGRIDVPAVVDAPVARREMGK